MGLLSVLFGEDSAPAKFAAENENALGMWGAGLASGKNFGDGLSKAVPLLVQGRALDGKTAKGLQSAEKLKAMVSKYPDLIQAIDADAPPGEVFNEFFSREQQARTPKDPLEAIRLKQAQLDYEQDVAGKGGTATTFGVTPIWGQFADGTMGYGVQGTDGTFKKVDTGGMTVLDPRTLNIEKAAGQAIGKGQGTSVAQAPSQIANAEMALGLIEEIRNNPELPWATGRGAAFGLNDARLNPQRAAFEDLVNQAKSGAFLSSIQQLQGLGALSNAEGAAATAAANRINVATDKESFLKALSDYEAFVNKGMEKAKTILASQGLDNLGLPAPAGGGDPAGQSVYATNPQTGQRLMLQNGQWVPAQ